MLNILLTDQNIPDNIFIPEQFTVKAHPALFEREGRRRGGGEEGRRGGGEEGRRGG